MDGSECGCGVICEEDDVGRGLGDCREWIRVGYVGGVP